MTIYTWTSQARRASDRHQTGPRTQRLAISPGKVRREDRQDMHKRHILCEPADGFFGKGMLPKSQVLQFFLTTPHKAEQFTLNSRQRHDSMLAIVFGKAHSFWGANLPSVNFDSGNDPNYHTTKDLTANIDFAQLTGMAKMVVAALAELEQQ